MSMMMLRVDPFDFYRAKAQFAAPYFLQRSKETDKSLRMKKSTKTHYQELFPQM